MSNYPKDTNNSEKSLIEVLTNDNTYDTIVSTDKQLDNLFNCNDNTHKDEASTMYMLGLIGGLY